MTRLAVARGAARASPARPLTSRTGGFAQGFLKAGAGIFVSTLWWVVDEPACRFTEVFYGQLVSGHSVADAATVAPAEVPGGWGSNVVGVCRIRPPRRPRSAQLSFRRTIQGGKT
jgi:hypothetical protein